jgi:hypothetical protein
MSRLAYSVGLSHFASLREGRSWLSLAASQGQTQRAAMQFLRVSRGYEILDCPAVLTKLLLYRLVNRRG